MPGAIFSSPNDEPEAHRARESGGFLLGMRNYLIEGVSDTGKTSVCNELQRRGYHAIHGDRELAYQGDPETGTPTYGLKHEQSAIFTSEHHIWDIEKVKALVANRDEAVTFFCGCSKSFPSSSIYLTAFLSLRLTLAPWTGGLTSEWHWTQLTGSKTNGTGSHCAIAYDEGRHSKDWCRD
jgi:hypothetical protein